MKPDSSCEMCDQITRHDHETTLEEWQEVADKKYEKFIENQKGGIKYDQEKIPLSLIPSSAIFELGKVLGFGARKYDAHNWRKGISYSRLISAALRHITAYNNGEDKDKESGLSHISHALCCLAFLSEFEAQARTELDDRYKGEK